MEEILQVVGCVLVTLGLIELIRALALAIMTPKKHQYWVMTIPIAGHREDAEYQIRGAAARVRWAGGCRLPIAVVDCGMDEETRVLCQEVCNSMDCVWIVDLDQLDALLMEPKLAN